jgi:hypothetical protein
MSAEKSKPRSRLPAISGYGAMLFRSARASRSYHVYADPSGCTCAYVGSVAAMEKYRASFGALPADTLSSSGFTHPEQNMINSMENDDAGAQFNNDVLGPDF